MAKVGLVILKTEIGGLCLVLHAMESSMLNLSMPFWLEPLALLDKLVCDTLIHPEVFTWPDRTLLSPWPVLQPFLLASAW